MPLHEQRLELDSRYRELRLLEAVLASAGEAAVIYDAQPLGSAEARIVFANAAYVDLMGGSLIEHIGQKPILIDGGVLERGSSPRAVRHRRPDGTSIALELSFVPIEDERRRLSLVVAYCREAELGSSGPRALAGREDKRIVGRLRRELRDRKRVEKILLEATCRDGLTGLPNRLLFLELVKEALSKTKRSGTSLAVLFVDCDRFKFVNDTHGHLVGDALLVEVAERLKRCLRPSDVLARIGGDEFVVLLRGGNTLGAATSVSQRLSKTFSMPFKLEGEELYLSASIGLAVSTTGDEIAEDLMRDANIAMYQAKNTGGQRCVTFSPDLRAGLVRHRTVETDLRRALEHSELCIAYQPIVRLADNELVGFEALARWEHATLGSVSPAEFIAVAEDSKLIVELGDWILHQACVDLRQWQRGDCGDANLSVSVNVSAKQLMDERFTRRVASALMQSGLAAESLHLEITESSLMVDSDMASALLGRLRAMGVRSHVDDFGTGYASLTYLQRFPVTALKVDRSFVSGSGEGLANPVIVKMIVRLAADLGLRVVAEGIETAAQTNELKSFGCDYGQGYLFARPLSVAAIPAYLAERRNASSSSERITEGCPVEARAISAGGSTISRTGPV